MQFFANCALRLFSESSAPYSRSVAADSVERSRHFGNTQLHASREAIAVDSRGQFAVAGKLFEVTLIQAFQKTASRSVCFRCNAVRYRKISERLDGIEFRSLKCRWKETGAPVIHAGLRCSARIGNGDVSRQIFIFEPSAHVVHAPMLGKPSSV